MPARSVKHQDDLLGGTGSRLTREFCQLDFKERDADRGGQMEEGAAGGGMDEPDEIAPGEALLHGGDGPLADRRPHPPQERFQANAMFIGGPQLHLSMGKGGGYRTYERSDLFLNSACCSASASAWRGSGSC